MNYAEVLHDGCKNRYWFKINEGYGTALDIKRGDRVLCDTAMGIVPGTVARVLYGVSEKEFLEIFHFCPTREIIGVYKTVKVSDISIPHNFKDFIPDVKKLTGRIKEFKRWFKGSGDEECFHTNIEVTQHNFLKDGYTAYLVAKMFGLISLPCLVSVGYQIYGKRVVKKGKKDE